nr:MAG TPA: Honey bee toxin [Caudoviricetes sp.]
MCLYTIIVYVSIFLIYSYFSYPTSWPTQGHHP